MKARPKLIAVVGGSGSGKTWLAEQLCCELGRGATRLSLDDFYRDRSHLPPARRARVNFDNPRAIDWSSLERVLTDCRAGKPVLLPRYDFATHARRAEWRRWRPGRFVIVDGLWLLRRPAVRRLFDFTIYRDCPEDLRFRRRLKRDVRERGRTAGSVRAQFFGAVAPMHARFVAGQRRWARLVLERPLSAPAVRKLAERIKTG